MITWWEIQVPDLEQGKAFYGGVFGWTFKSWMEGYDVAHDANGQMVCAIQLDEREAAGRHMHIVFSVDAYGDTLEQALAKVTEHGGTIRTPRTRIAPDMGWYATVLDPSGLSFDLSTRHPEK
ncbi:MAG TPA: VOC family protein [Candidatus Limnocylindrales bacterium]|nr:VOC family protein [Candidatus Limnocylindrales bacterium]